MNKNLVLAVVVVLVLAGAFAVLYKGERNTAEQGGTTSASISSGEAVVKEVKEDENTILAEFTVEVDGKNEKFNREVNLFSVVFLGEKSDEDYQKELAVYEEMLESFKPDPYHPEKIGRHHLKKPPHDPFRSVT